MAKQTNSEAFIFCSLFCLVFCCILCFVSSLVPAQVCSAPASESRAKLFCTLRSVLAILSATLPFPFGEGRSLSKHLYKVLVVIETCLRYTFKWLAPLKIKKSSLKTIPRCQGGTGIFLSKKLLIVTATYFSHAVQ